MRFTQTTTTHNTLVDDDDRTFELMFEPADDPLVGDLPSGDVVVSYLTTDNEGRYGSVEEFFVDEWCGGEDLSDFWRSFDDGHERNEWIEEHLATCADCGCGAGEHPFTDGDGDGCETFRPRVVWTDRMFWIEKYEHGVVNYAPTGHSSQVDRQWDVAPGVAILTIPDDWGDTDTPEGLFSAASKVCASFTAWCNGWVYGVVHETFRHVEEPDGSERWERVDDEACWGYIGEENAENVLTGGHTDMTGGVEVSRVVVVRDDGEGRRSWWNGCQFRPQRSEASITDLADQGPGGAAVVVGVRELAEGRVRVEPADQSPTSWLEEARGWAAHRSEVSAAEGNGTADPDDWANSDDQAVILVQRAISVLEAVVDMDAHAWLDNAARFTCSEADAVAALLRGLLSHDLAEAFLDAHAEKDSELEEDDPAHLARKEK